MQCVTPMFRKYNVDNYKDGKIVPRAEVMEGLVKNPKLIRHMLKNVNNYNRFHNIPHMYELIPCNHCYACNLNYSAEWATRCMLEVQNHPEGSCWWLTLTYNEEHLPLYNEMTCDIQYKNVEGEIIETETKHFYNDGTWNGTLEPEHVTQFIDTIRHYYRKKGVNNIKYFYCGEYGGVTSRPHYHIILFGVPLDNNLFYSPHVDGKFFKEHWKSKQIDKWWTYGMHDLAILEWSNAAYTTRYCMKKLIEGKADNELYAAMGKIPEFVRMSKGIGFTYYEKHKQEIYETDSIIMKTVKGNTGAIKPPKSFDRRLEKQNPELHDKIKKKRKATAETAFKNDLIINNSNDLDKLKRKAEKVILKAAQLPRDGDFG